MACLNAGSVAGVIAYDLKAVMPIILNTVSLMVFRISIFLEDVYWLEDRKEKLTAERLSNGIK